MNLVYPLAHLMGGVILLCAFSMLSQRRLAAMITLYQVQALTFSAAAFWQGFAQSAGDLYLTGLITLVIKAILLPIGMRQIVQRFSMIRAVETTIPIGFSMILGVGLIGIAVLVVLPTTVSAVSLTREDLAHFAFSRASRAAGDDCAAPCHRAGDRFSLDGKRLGAGGYRHAGDAVCC